jgi:hypothetical protein
MKRSTMLPALAVLAAALTTTAACQSGAAATGGTAQPGAPASAGTAQPAQPPVATAPASQPPPTIAGGGGGDLCQLHADAGSILGSPDGPDPQQALQMWQQIYAAVPAEIKPDVQTIIDFVAPVVKGEVPADQIDQRMADPKLLTAMQRYGEYVQAHCGGVTGLPE